MARKAASPSPAEVESTGATAVAAATDVRRTVVVKTSPAALYAAFVEPSQLQRWLGAKSAIEGKKGGKASLDVAGGTREGKVTDVSPGEHLAIALVATKSTPASTLDVRLRAEGDGARLTLSESGFADAAASKAADRGWAHLLERLRSSLEDGPRAIRGTEEIATIAVSGGSPYGVAWDGKHLWHTDAGAGTLSKFDPSSGKVVSAHVLGGAPTGLDWDGESLWVLDPKRRAIQQVDPATGEVRRRLKVFRVAGDLTDVAWDGKNLWIGMTGEGGKIVRIDLRTGMAQGSISSPSAPSGIAFDREDVSHLWIAAVRERVLSRIETKSGTIVDRHGLRGEPAGLAWDGECLWHVDLEARALVRLRTL
jgi:uncharacterized protein YndB with AHSA1/START domain